MFRQHCSEQVYYLSVMPSIGNSVIYSYLLEAYPQSDVVFRQHCSEQVYYLSVMSRIGNSVIYSYLLEA